MIDSLLIKAYRSGVGRQWIVYSESAKVFGHYGGKTTGDLAQTLHVSQESIRNWAKCGLLRQACRGMKYTDETGREWDFYELRRTLSLAHFQIAARAVHREDVSPADAFEWLCISACDGMSAEKMSTELMPSASQFMARMQRLLDTPLPDCWTGQKRREFLVWLSAGRDLIEEENQSI